MKDRLAQAFDAYRPDLAETYTRMVRHAYQTIREKFGPELKGVRNSWDYARHFRGMVQPNLTQAEDGLDEARLARNAKEYAVQTVALWERKIRQKMGQLDSAEVHNLGGHTFLIEGTIQGSRVTIRQGVIVKVSSRGTVFNQWPARIYVDGQFCPAAQYQKRFGLKK